ncbi:GGDEF domain-containing protein [Ideonella sp.]|uniref:GGDEF domain-containing protein n=1 Tax=Ideonella sp. TaxID=1929293 RepID=UPI002B461524|nr:GGDEF domain-containing protein [Ideonella sp.]HJV70430.1 GGDEF domain-containing protein [Ideonella sp.]
MRPRARPFASVLRRAAAPLLAAVLSALIGAPPACAQAEVDPIERLESDGRAKPDVVADELERLLASGPIEGNARLDAEHLLGMLRATLHQPAAAEAVTQSLLKPGSPAYRGVAREHLNAAAVCIRAKVALADGGSLVRADTQLAEVESALRAVASARVRMRCLSTQALVKQRIGRTEDAVRLSQEVIRLADEANVAWRRSTYRSDLAYSLYRGGQLEHATRLNDEAKKIATEQQDWMSLAGVSTTESILLTDKGHPVEELAALNGAIDYARRAGALRDEALGLANLSDFYLHAAEYPRAYEIAQRAVPLARKLHDASTENLANLNSGLALISMRRKDEGLALVRPVLEYDRAANDIANLAEGTGDVATYLEKAGYLAEAYAAYQQLRGLSAELARREQQEAVLELQEGFDAQQRRREIALLNEDNALKEELLRRRELEYKIWALTAVIVLSLLALAARMYRGVRATQQALRQRTAQLKRHSLQDPLTGLANRRQFHELTEGEGCVSKSARGTLYLLDLDHFKSINDHHGHAAGDAVLVEIARRLRAVLREEDLVVRWGGEEFLVLVQAMTHERVEPLAQRLLNAVASMPVTIGEQRIDVTTSIGFAEFPLAPNRLELPWNLAVDIVDNAMYVAKTLGRNRACGVGLVPAATQAEVDAVVQDLERAWRDGRVQLAVLQGPQMAEVMA